MLSKLAFFLAMASPRVIAQHPDHAYSIMIFIFLFIVCAGIISGIGYQRSARMLSRLLIKTLDVFMITLDGIYGIWLISYCGVVFLVLVTSLAALISFIAGLPIFILFGFL